MFFLILYTLAVGSVSATDRDVLVELDADTIVDGFKSAIRSDYLKKLADDFASKTALVLIEELEKKKKRVKSTEFVEQSKHKVGRIGSSVTSRESEHRQSRHLDVSLLSGPKVPAHKNFSNARLKPHKNRETVKNAALRPQKVPEPVEHVFKPKKQIPKKSEQDLLNLLKEPSSDGDYPNREAELTDYEPKKSEKPVRTQEMINGKRFRARAVDVIYL